MSSLPTKIIVKNIIKVITKLNDCSETLRKKLFVKLSIEKFINGRILSLIIEEKKLISNK